MTDYSKTMRRPLPKRVAIWLLEKPWINAPVVALLRGLKGSAWRDRIPVMSGVGRIALPGGEAVVMCSPVRCNISREIFWHEGQLADAADRNALLLAIALSKNVEHFLDIGSYTGLFALSVARCNPKVRCHAFEIVPDNFLLLWQNIIHNDLIPRINVMFKGAGKAPGAIRLPVSLEAGVLPSSMALDSATPDGIEVPVDCVDNMLEIHSEPVVIKIDVEGFEWSVLSGARNLIEATRPDIICEFLIRAPDVPAVIDYLAPLGYAFYRITGTGLVRSDAIAPVKAERDWLLTVRSDAELQDLGWTVL